jgi:hypothetical protein
VVGFPSGPEIGPKSNHVDRELKRGDCGIQRMTRALLAEEIPAPICSPVEAIGPKGDSRRRIDLVHYWQKYLYLASQHHRSAARVLGEWMAESYAMSG